MSDSDDVLEAARRRGAALAAADAGALTALLHPDFRWATHVGTSLDRSAYVEQNTGGTVVWRGQELESAEVVVAGDTSVLHAVVADTVVVDGVDTAFRMPVTLTWVRSADGWVVLAGHAGPRL